MSDQRLRQLERAASSGDPDAEERYEAEVIRQGLCAVCKVNFAEPVEKPPVPFLGKVGAFLGKLIGREFGEYNKSPPKKPKCAQCIESAEDAKSLLDEQRRQAEAAARVADTMARQQAAVDRMMARVDQYMARVDQQVDRISKEADRMLARPVRPRTRRSNRRRS